MLAPSRPLPSGSSVGRLLVLATISLAAVVARAEFPCGSPACEPAACGNPDVWIVSTRHLPRICHPVTDAAFRVERRDGPGCWTAASTEDLPATDRPVVFFIHGNRYDVSSAKRQGVALARRLDQCRPEASPVRVVVLSWPSESNGFPLREARDNYVRAEADGHYFGALLSRFPSSADIGIVSYSFGSKIALVGLDDLHAIAPDWHAGRTGFLGTVLVTPAVRVDSLSPCGRYHRALSAADRVLLFTNPRDEALRFFPMIDHSGVDAAGYVGIPRRWLRPETEFLQLDASPIVGKEHSMQRFIDSWTLGCQIAAGAIQ